MSDHNESEGGAGGHMAASFTDLMASLMVIFALLFVANVNNALASRRSVQDNLLKELREQLAGMGLGRDAIRQDERDPNAIVIVMSDSLLFGSDTAEVRPAGRRYLTDFMPRLATILCGTTFEQNIQTVVVEGHTDTTYKAGASANAGRAYNLELSQKRSMDVVKTSLTALEQESTLACFRGLLSASGRGQEEPLRGIRGDDPRLRRVLFKIRVHNDLAGQLTKEVSADARPSTDVEATAAGAGRAAVMPAAVPGALPAPVRPARPSITPVVSPAEAGGAVPPALPSAPVGGAERGTP